MLKQKQIQFLTFANLAALTASTLNTPEFAFITAENCFYTKIAGVNTKINPDAFVALSSDVVSTATGGVTTIQSNVVTNAKLAQMGANTLKGNNTGATANATDLSIADIKTLLAYTASDITSTATGDVAATTIQAAIAELASEKVATSAVGAVNGVASLDGTGKVPAAQLPSYVDDVLEYATQAAFPVTGETSIIYVVTSGVDINKIYRWTGSVMLKYLQMQEHL